MVANPTFSNGDTKIGCVKWFNNHAGYGFITLTEIEATQSYDIFVHHSSIDVTKNQYKYLVQGEYVSFTLEKVDNEKYSHQAKSVRGINGGPLMCETRAENVRPRTKENQPRGQIVNKVDLGKQWMLVQRRPHNRANNNSTRKEQANE